MENEFLIVAEKFFSIQGEGQTTGTPAVFLRLTGCNILCQSESWICDTIAVWKKGVKTKFKEVLEGELFDKLELGSHLVITGGEPLLHQKKVIEFLQWFEKKYNWLPVLEFETNGTIQPNSYLVEKVSYWNVSPKLENSGEKHEKRFKPEVIKFFNSLPNSIFKFVISKVKDFEDLERSYLSFVNSKKVYLMPAGENRIQLNKTRKVAIGLCKKYAFHYSERLHIVIWNKKTGV